MGTYRFINRFRNPIKLQSEAGYYHSSLVSFFFFVCNCVLRQTLDGCCVLHWNNGSHFTIEYHSRGIWKVRCVCLPRENTAHFRFSNVEEAIQALPISEPHSSALPFVQAKAQSLSALSPHAGEESAQLLAISTPTFRDEWRLMRLILGYLLVNIIYRVYSKASNYEG